MTKAELIKELEQYPDDVEIVIWDTEIEIIEPIDDIRNCHIGKYNSNEYDEGKQVITLTNRKMLEYHNIAQVGNFIRSKKGERECHFIIS